MARNASRVLVDTLIAWGIDTVFGLPGDGINGIMEALRERKDAVRFIQVRHEERHYSNHCTRRHDTVFPIIAARRSITWTSWTIYFLLLQQY